MAEAFSARGVTSQSVLPVEGESMDATSENDITIEDDLHVTTGTESITVRLEPMEAVLSPSEIKEELEDEEYETITTSRERRQIKKKNPQDYEDIAVPTKKRRTQASSLAQVNNPVTKTIQTIRVGKPDASNRMLQVTAKKRAIIPMEIQTKRASSEDDDDDYDAKIAGDLYRCSYPFGCPDTFPTKELAMKHYSFEHLGFKNAFCPACYMGFPTIASCRKHITVRHKDDREDVQTLLTNVVKANDNHRRHSRFAPPPLPIRDSDDEEDDDVIVVHHTRPAPVRPKRRREPRHGSHALLRAAQSVLRRTRQASKSASAAAKPDARIKERSQKVTKRIRVLEKRCERSQQQRHFERSGGLQRTIGEVTVQSKVNLSELLIQRYQDAKFREEEHQEDLIALARRSRVRRLRNRHQRAQTERARSKWLLDDQGYAQIPLWALSDMFPRSEISLDDVSKFLDDVDDDQIPMKLLKQLVNRRKRCDVCSNVKCLKDDSRKLNTASFDPLVVDIMPRKAQKSDSRKHMKFGWVYEPMSEHKDFMDEVSDLGPVRKTRRKGRIYVDSDGEIVAEPAEKAKSHISAGGDGSPSKSSSLQNMLGGDSAQTFMMVKNATGGYTTITVGDIATLLENKGASELAHAESGGASGVILAKSDGTFTPVINEPVVKKKASQDTIKKALRRKGERRMQKFREDVKQIYDSVRDDSDEDPKTKKKKKDDQRLIPVMVLQNPGIYPKVIQDEDKVTVRPNNMDELGDLTRDQMRMLNINRCRPMLTRYGRLMESERIDPDRMQNMRVMRVHGPNNTYQDIVTYKKLHQPERSRRQGTMEDKRNRSKRGKMSDEASYAAANIEGNSSYEASPMTMKMNMDFDDPDYEPWLENAINAGKQTEFGGGTSTPAPHVVQRGRGRPPVTPGSGRGRGRPRGSGNVRFVTRPRQRAAGTSLQPLTSRGGGVKTVVMPRLQSAGAPKTKVTSIKGLPAAGQPHVSRGAGGERVVTFPSQVNDVSTTSPGDEAEAKELTSQDNSSITMTATVMGDVPATGGGGERSLELIPVEGTEYYYGYDPLDASKQGRVYTMMKTNAGLQLIPADVEVAKNIQVTQPEGATEGQVTTQTATQQPTQPVKRIQTTVPTATPAPVTQHNQTIQLDDGTLIEGVSVVTNADGTMSAMHELPDGTMDVYQIN